MTIHGGTSFDLPTHFLIKFMRWSSNNWERWRSLYDANEAIASCLWFWGRKNLLELSLIWNSRKIIEIEEKLSSFLSGRHFRLCLGRQKWVDRYIENTKMNLRLLESFMNVMLCKILNWSNLVSGYHIWKALYKCSKFS